MKYAFIPGSFKPPHLGHFKLVEELLKNSKIDKIYIIIGKKPRCLFSNTEKCITQEQSYQVWNIYFDLLESRKKVVLIKSRETSPLLTAKGIANKILKKGDTLVLVKSRKNMSNTRFDMFKTLQNIKIEMPILKVFDSLSSTGMREAIFKGDRKKFNQYLPPKLDMKTKNEIWKLLAKK